MGSCRVEKCRAAELFDDVESAVLMAEYAEESAIALLGKLSPSREWYEQLEYSGYAQCFAVRDGSVLVGFACLLHAVVPHYGLNYANTESIFVRRSARSDGAGTDLMHALEEYAQDVLGCKGLFYSAPVGSRMARMLGLKGQRYTRTSEVFCRVLA